MAGGIAAPVDYSPDHRLHHNQLPETRLRKAPLVRNNISQNLLNPRSPPRNLAIPANFPKSSAEFWRIQHPMLEGAHICEPL